MKTLAIIGQGGHARVLADAAEGAGWAAIVLIGDTPEDPAPWPCAGSLNELLHGVVEADACLVGIGDNSTRLGIHRCLAREAWSTPRLLHPRAGTSPRARLGAGSVVLAGAWAGVGTTIGEAVILNTGATVDHDCVLGDGVHVSPGAHLAGGVRVGECSWIGIGAVVRQGITIGRDAVVGAGAVVVADVPDGITVVGNPARPLER
ncbi:NeuD/PglB/VioB family sugar acetyltransferase [Brevundimonas bacteroides]|uniref:NeuD/PglB/VioB family sugar acetyltransferase n=1 Tax=Brevundimonas bacteroides TaxID=74311 RepID=UPI0004959643|nr:NeuD/PglB/VioB family sugar acetyltransferase [Brevundimonas bacteroides]